MKPIDEIQRRKLQRAVTQTVSAYRKLIRKPRRYARYWGWYGSPNGCRFCRVILDEPGQEMECPGCPLAQNNGLASCGGPTMQRLRAELGRDTKRWDRLSQAAQNRLDWLIRRFEKAGYVVNGREDQDGCRD